MKEQGLHSLIQGQLDCKQVPEEIHIHSPLLQVCKKVLKQVQECKKVVELNSLALVLV